MRLSHLLQEQRTCRVKVGDDFLNVTYRPGSITPLLESQLRELIGNQQGGAALIAVILSAVTDWDLVDDDDKPLPVTAEVLEGLPLAFLGKVAEAILGDLRPNPQSGGSFAAG